MKYDFITIGGATRDISFFTDQGVLIDNKKDILRQKLLGFEYGAKIKVDEFRYDYGGGAANAAVCLSNFGFKSACLACVGGDDNGRSIIANLRKNKVNAGLVKVKKDEKSGTSFILVSKSGERIIFGSRGANRELSLSAADLAALKRSGRVYLASLSGDWMKILKDIFSTVGAGGPEVYWNPGGSQIKAGLKKIAPFLVKTKVFSLNKDEAIELVMGSGRNSGRNQKAARSLLENEEELLAAIKSYGPDIVVITLGEKGVIATDGRKIYRRRILKEKKRVDTTGVGDIFNSSFAAGLALYGEIGKALDLGLRNTAAKISNFGAQNGLLNKKDI